MLTDVTLMEGALGRMNFVSWKRPLCCQFRTIGTLQYVSVLWKKLKCTENDRMSSHTIHFRYHQTHEQ